MAKAFIGNYIESLFDASKRYRFGGGINSNGIGYKGSFQPGVPVSSTELNSMSDVSDSFIRQLISSNYPTGSSTNSGFKNK